MSLRHVIVISRKWNNPKISVVVTDEELSFAIDLDDFMKAVKMELGVEGEFATKISVAVDTVLRGIKGESVKVMG
jgi:hypothetical protein